jgi:hypothetical protein
LRIGYRLGKFLRIDQRRNIAHSGVPPWVGLRTARRQRLRIQFVRLGGNVVRTAWTPGSQERIMQ